MDLKDASTLRNKRRYNGALESAGRGDHVVGFHQAMRRFDQEAGPPLVSLNFPYLDAATNRSRDFFCIGDEIVRNFLLGDKRIRRCIGKLQTRESIMPRWTVSYQRVPSFGAPAFCNAMPLKDDMRDAAFTQML